MSKYWVIFKETYLRNIKSPGFIIMLVMPIIASVIIGFVSNLVSNEQQKANEATISIVSPNQELVQLVKSNNSSKLTVEEATMQQAIDQLKNNDVAGILTVEMDESGTLHSTFNRKSNSDSVNMTEIDALLTQIQVSYRAKQMNLTAEQVASLTNTKITTETNKIDEKALENNELVIADAGSDKEFFRQGVAYVSAFILYFFLLTFSSMSGQEIASEKGTRMMEIILSSVDAKVHFLGKLSGISAVVLTMLFAYGAYAVIGFNLMDTSFLSAILKGNDILTIAGDLLLVTGIFVLIGSLMFLTLSALAGSMVSKVEDVQKTMTPLIFSVIIGFYIGMFAVNAPNNALVVVSSFIPVLSPFIIPFRLATGAIDTVQLLTIIGVNVLFTVLIVFISIVFYKTNVLIYSDRGPLQVLKQSFTILRSEKK